MVEKIFSGTPASKGLSIGQIWRPASRLKQNLENRSDDEAGALRQAIFTATENLAKLENMLSGNEAEIVNMQIAFLGDEELARPAFSAIEAGQHAVDAWKKTMNREIAAYQMSEDEYFRARAVDFEDIRDRVLAVLTGHSNDILNVPDGSILLMTDLRPSQFLSAHWGEGAGIALTEGSPTSHVAMLARGRGIPMVVALKGELNTLEGQVILDGTEGILVFDPKSERVAEGKSRLKSETDKSKQNSAFACQPAISRNGVQIEIHATLADPAELDHLNPDHFDGIGLVRTELFIDSLEKMMDEERQFEIYKRILIWANGKPVTIRTLDAGGDKPIAGYTVMHEANPFLGMRGIRLSLAHPDIFRVQLRALSRAALYGKVKVMLPMVTLPDEIIAARNLLEEEMAALSAQDIAHGVPELGIMVEVPAVAITPQRFNADFYSIGSNDLVQYTCAISRDAAETTRLGSAIDPSVLALISCVSNHGRKTNRNVSLCGDAGGDPNMVPQLLAAGLRSLSVQPALSGAVKALIADLVIDDKQQEPE
ncbi:phosphoenolpyruvate--protein phosphotransferase [Brucellaceae bacterium C25G]